MDLGMGRYGAYVWSSVGLTLVLLALNLWSAHASLRDAQRAARRAAGAAGGSEQQR
jgi:heme exporter protein CcmD